MAKKVNTKKRLTFIDIVLILAVLGLAAFVVYSVFFADETVYTGSKEIGKVLAVEYEPYFESTGEVNESGELIYCEYPGYINLLITVQTKAEKTDAAYSVSGVSLLANKEISFRTRTFCQNAEIVKITEKGESES